MRCIFCKSDSSNSKSVEHIIPESLGNVEHVLPPGIVCDKCNNYFSLKIEKKMLEQPYFTSLRFRQRVESKKGRYPLQRGISITTKIEVDVGYQPAVEVEPGVKKNEYHVFCKREGDLEKITAPKHGSIIIPAYYEPEKENKIISRFLGKVGIEWLASEFIDSDEILNEFINDPKLDPLRNYVRYGKPDIIWPYNLRRIYDEDKRFYEDDLDFQMLHEMTLLHTDFPELYIVICIFGVEYCLNMGGPDLYGYHEWLDENNYKSPLEPEFWTHLNRSNIDEWDKRNKKKLKKKYDRNQ